MEQVLEENKNMIYAMTNYFKGYNSKEDLFQAGCIGLFKAYYKFDSKLGVKFSTYAYTYILGEMKKLVREDKGIKISRDICSTNMRIDKNRSILEQELLRNPTNKELAEYMEEDEAVIEEAIQSVGCLQSFDYVLNEDGKELTLYDVIGENMNIDMILELKEQLEQLDPIEQQIILSRYMNDLTQKQTANILGMNQVQVSRRENKVLMKLREGLTQQ